MNMNMNIGEKLEKTFWSKNTKEFLWKPNHSRQNNIEVDFKEVV